MTRLSYLILLVTMLCVIPTNVHGQGNPGGQAQPPPPNNSNNNNNNSPPQVSFSDLLSSTSVGDLRRHASNYLAERSYSKSLKLYSRCISLEPTNAQNYLKRFKLYKRVQRVIDGAQGNAAVLKGMKLGQEINNLSEEELTNRYVSPRGCPSKKTHTRTLIGNILTKRHRALTLSQNDR